MNGFIQAADNDEVDGSGNSFVDSASEFFKYGTTSTAISAGVGIWNSVKAIGNTMGADLAMTNEADVVQNLVGQEAQDYYLENKTAIDLGGLVVSAVGTGLLALKAFRGIQAMGNVAGTGRFGFTNAMGVVNPDIVLASKQAHNLRVAVQSNISEFTWRNKEFAYATGWAARQNLQEALVMEAAYITLNNQNSLLNPEQLSAWDSAKNLAVEGLPFVALGAAIGTTIDVARLYGTAKGAFRAIEGGNNANLRVITSDAITTFNPSGDKLYDAMRLAKLLREDPKYAVDLADPAAAATYQKALDQVEQYYNESVLALNKADGAGLDVVAQVAAKESDLDQLAIFGNLVAMERPTLAHHTDMLNLYAKSGAVDMKSVEQAGSFDEAVASLRELNRAKLQGQSTLWKALGGMLQSSKSGVVNDLVKYAEEIGDSTLQAVLADARILAKQGTRLPATDAVLRTLELERKGIKIAGTSIPPELADDLLAAISGVASRLQHQVTGAEAAAKYPAIAKFLNQQGAYAKSWDAVTGWYNVRTGRALTSVLPRAQDLGKVQELAGGITIAGTKLEFTYTVDATDPFNVLARIAKQGNDLQAEHPALEVSAVWAAAALRPLEKFKIGTEYRVHAKDLPAIERVATGMKDDELVKLTGVIADFGEGSGKLTKTELVEFLRQQKESARAAYQMAGYNEQLIANLLNTGEKFALGQAADDFMLMGKMDYSKSENVLMRYKKYGTRQVDLASRDFQGIMARTEAQQAAEAKAFGRVVGQEASMFPEEALDLLKTLSATELRAGAVNSATSEFGRFREWAGYVGNLTHGIKDASRQRIERALYPHLEALSKEENYAGRAQLALFNNMARRDDYRVIRLTDVQGSSHMAIKEEVYADFIDQQLKAGRSEMEAIDMLSRKEVAEGLIGSKSALGLRPDVGALVDTHMAMNSKYIRNDYALAAASGRYVNRKEGIYYAPPVDLRVTPHFRFVIPLNEQNKELGRFMIFGSSAAELEAKAAYAAQQYGSTHRIVDSGQISLIKKLRGEYEEGKVFSDFDFDPNMRKMGTASEAQPSLDIYAAESMDLMRNWHHNKAESQIMQAVELRYSTTMQALNKANSAFDSGNLTALGERKAVLGVYEDTRRTMLDSKTYEGAAADMYRRVNDVVSATGGKVIHTAAEAIRGMVGKGKFGGKEMEQLTKELNDSGFVNPYDNLTTLLSRSAVVSDGRELNSLMRLGNTLVASAMLRLDFMNSALQLMSTPLLLTGAIKEAKLSLKGTAAGRTLTDLTTVVNPANGVREPTAAKLMGEAIQKWFTKEGSEFAEELRKRFMLTDYNRQFLEAHDYSSLNGRHTINTVQQKLDNLAVFGSKFTLHQKSEDMSRFMVAWSMKRIAETRGLGQDETFALIRNAIDKVHGVYRSHQRVQLFNGVVGQSIGLFQTYMFNMAQYMVRHVSEGAGKQAALAAFMQSTMFGIRSLPAFGTLNKLVADTNNGKLDLYTLSGSEADPSGLGSYLLYGLGSHALVAPVDFFSRGDIVARQATIVPTDLADLPSVSVIGKAVGNIIDMGKMLGNGQDVSTVLSYGLAHNALNRPLQGLGTIMLGAVTTSKGTPVFLDSNYTGYNVEEGLNYAAIGGRLLGGKPKTEAILLDSYYRRMAYQQEQSKNLAALGSQLRVQLQSEEGVSDDVYTNFFNEYSSEGGTPENFHQFLSRNMGQATTAAVDQFRVKMQGDNPTSRAYNRLLQERSDVPMWELDAELDAEPAQE